jgi:hypothetical protein
MGMKRDRSGRGEAPAQAGRTTMVTQAEIVRNLADQLIANWRRLQRSSKHPNSALRRVAGNTQRKIRANGGNNGRRKA